MTGDAVRATDSAILEKSEELGDLAAGYLVRVTFRNAVDAVATPPTLAQLGGALEAALLTHFPDFTATVRAERTDR